jgi:hypothetical protein
VDEWLASKRSCCPRRTTARPAGFGTFSREPLDLVRRIVGVTAWASLDIQRHVAQHPAPELCLCVPCCGDSEDRMLAKMSHRMNKGGGVHRER